MYRGRRETKARKEYRGLRDRKGLPERKALLARRGLQARPERMERAYTLRIPTQRLLHLKMLSREETIRCTLSGRTESATSTARPKATG